MKYDYLAELVKHKRKERNLSKGALAAMMGIDDWGRIALIEGGRQGLPVNLCIELATALGIDPGELVRLALYHEYPEMYKALFRDLPPPTLL